MFVARGTEKQFVKSVRKGVKVNERIWFCGECETLVGTRMNAESIFLLILERRK